MTTHTRFQAWMRSTGRRQVDLGELLGGYSAAHLCHIAQGRHRPSRRLAIAIERLTAIWADGPIRVADWSAETSPSPDGIGCGDVSVAK